MPKTDPDSAANAAVMLTAADLSALMSQAVTAAVAAALDAAKRNSPESPEQVLRRMTAQSLERPPSQESRVAARSMYTGAEFVAVFHHRRDGSVTLSTLEEYKHPPQAANPPGGMMTHIQGSETREYRQWKWTTYLQKDLIHFAGCERSLALRMMTVLESEPVAAE